jgi:hypothetical protein
VAEISRIRFIMEVSEAGIVDSPVDRLAGYVCLNVV